MMLEKYQSLLKDMASESDLYHPSSFWSAASKEIVEDINENGIEHFRRLTSALLFFVPTYGYPGLGLTKEQLNGLDEVITEKDISFKQKTVLEQFASGYANAFADYRVFLATVTTGSENNKALLNFSESCEGNPVEHFEFDQNRYSRSALNYLLGLAFLGAYVDLKSIRTVLEVGGGFGTLGEIFLKSFTDSKYIDIDIPPTSLASEYYLQKVFGEESVTTYQHTKSLETIDIVNLDRASVLNAWQIEKLTGSVDLFVNFISFQEMEPNIVKNYLYHVNRLNAKWVLLRNMREGKQLKTENSVGVEVPIFSDDYIEMLGEYELVSRNVIPFGYKTADDFHSELMLFKRKNQG